MGVNHKEVNNIGGSEDGRLGTLVLFRKHISESSILCFVQEAKRHSLRTSFVSVLPCSCAHPETTGSIMSQLLLLGQEYLADISVQF